MEEVKDTIFVGGIPYDMTLEEFEEEVAIWGKKIFIGIIYYWLKLFVQNYSGVNIVNRSGTKWCF